MAAPNLDNLPVELTGLRQACVRYDKQPYIKNPKTGKLTASWAGAEGAWTGPEGYLTFSESRKLLEDSATVRVNIGGEWADRPITGVGFMNARAADPARQIVGGDLDCCRNPITGNIGRWAYTLLHKIQPFYVEVSPSQTGVRFFAMGHLPDDVDSMTGYGDQDDLPASDREAILTAKPKAREKIAKGKPAFNGVELYVNSRHLTITGDKLPTYCYAPEDSTNALAEALRDYLAEPVEEQPIKKNKSTKKAGSFPPLNILQVIDTTGFEEHGGELVGSHPTEGSITGANLKVNPGKGVWSYLHDFRGGTAPGGDAWMWLACECGAVPWMSAGAGMMVDPVVIAKTMQHAADRGLIPETEDIIAAFRRSKGEKKPEEPTTLTPDIPPGNPGHNPEGWFDGQFYGRPKTEEEMLIKGMSQEEFDKYQMPEGPKLVVNLPPDNLITRMMGYGSAVCDAYVEYWFMAALFALAVVSDKKIKYELSSGTIYMNLYIYLLGKSSLARKSTVVALIEDMLLKVLGSFFAESVVPTEFSSESFIEHMDKHNHAAWIRDEAAGVISIMKKDYMRGFKENLMQLFDCRKITRKLRTSERKNVQKEFNVTDPFLNLLFASTDAALGLYMEAVDTLSGFLARFLFAFPQHENPNYMPLCKGNAKQSELEEVCRNQLIGIATFMMNLPECVDMENSPEAQAYWAEWGEKRERAMAKLKDGYSSQIMGRLNTMALKFAMAFEVGQPGFEPTTPIRLEFMVEACRLIDSYFLPTTRAVYELVANEDKKNHIAHMLGYLARNGGRATKKAVMRDEKIIAKDMAAFLETMVECEQITIENVYNAETKRNTAWLFLVDNREVGEVEEVSIVGKVGKVDSIHNRETTISTNPTLLPLPTLETPALQGVECKDAKIPEKSTANPGKEKFMQGLKKHTAKKKRTCHICERTFDYDLTPDQSNQTLVDCYLCTTCLMEHRTREKPIETITQTQL